MNWLHLPFRILAHQCGLGWLAGDVTIDLTQSSHPSVETAIASLKRRNIRALVVSFEGGVIKGTFTAAMRSHQRRLREFISDDFVALVGKLVQEGIQVCIVLPQLSSEDSIDEDSEFEMTAKDEMNPKVVPRMEDVRELLAACIHDEAIRKEIMTVHRPHSFVRHEHVDGTPHQGKETSYLDRLHMMLSIPKESILLCDHEMDAIESARETGFQTSALNEADGFRFQNCFP
eukprot:TRINITY_DN81173_c0_g1_i1.p1 TRINITY_DN81173_c0_g1~~TRINITY_DN81173_c0_g1_i1.p1  ORF type:complete len:231 (+),score=52.33 TRINITY_DN81173_c0_g1_i1:115-807(+)